MATKQIKRVPMFRVGDYGDKGRYTEQDLDLMAQSYDPAYLEAPVTEDHKEFGPAWGWIEKVYRDGDTLYGDWQVHSETYDLLKEGRYKRRSIEFYRKHTMPDGRQVPYVKACSILGAATPHCKGLPNITFTQRDEPAERITFDERNEPMQTTKLSSQEEQQKQFAIEQLADKLIANGYVTDRRDAVAMAEVEIEQHGLRKQTAAPEQEANQKAAAWHEHRDDIAKLADEIMQANPTKDYFEACREAERSCLS